MGHPAPVRRGHAQVGTEGRAPVAEWDRTLAGRGTPRRRGRARGTATFSPAARRCAMSRAWRGRAMNGAVSKRSATWSMPSMTFSESDRRRGGVNRQPRLCASRWRRTRARSARSPAGMTPSAGRSPNATIEALIQAWPRAASARTVRSTLRMPRRIEGRALPPGPMPPGCPAFQRVGPLGQVEDHCRPLARHAPRAERLGGGAHHGRGLLVGDGARLPPPAIWSQVPLFRPDDRTADAARRPRRRTGGRRSTGERMSVLAPGARVGGDPAQSGAVAAARASEHVIEGRRWSVRWSQPPSRAHPHPSRDRTRPRPRRPPASRDLWLLVEDRPRAGLVP